MSINLTTLDNGIRIATNNIIEAQSISIIIMINVGSRDESIDNNGISHFLEHMAFKGTNNRTAKMIAEEFDLMGGYFNAYTSREQTTYSFKILKSDLDKTLDIIADILQNSIFSDEEIRKEFNVITQEIAASVDSPDDIIFDNWQKTAYPNQALGRPILGSVDIISKFTDIDFKKYINLHYNCANIVISLVGNIEHNQIIDVINDKFISFTNNISPINEKATYKGGAHYQKRKLEQSHLLIGFKGYSYLEKEIYPLTLFTSLIGGGLSSRLFQELREKRGLCYSIESFYSSYRDGGDFLIYTSADDNNISDIIKVIAEQMIDVIDNINEKELILTKAQIKASILMNSDNYLYKAEEIARSITHHNRYIKAEEIIDNLNSCTKDYISKTVKTILDSNISSALIGKRNVLSKYGDLKNIFNR